MPHTLAAIDVGTNSLHLVVARAVGDGGFDVLTTDKEMVRLGSGGGDMRRLSPAAMDRGIAALSRFRLVADSWGAVVRAVATSAVREADNHDEFLRRARQEAGIDVEVVSGVEEARLIHLGVLQALPVYDRRLLLMDIGGGSTELLVGERGDVLAARSFKLGSIRLTDRFFGGTKVHPAAVAACRTHVRAAITPFLRELDALGYEVAIGSSGTIQALAAMAAAADGIEPRSLNAFSLTADQLHEVVGRIAAAPTVAARAKLPGLEPHRADIILAGGLLLDEVVRAAGVKELTISGYALREGVLLDTLQRFRGGDVLHHLRDVSRRSVVGLMELLDAEPEHARTVARLALELFDATGALHGLDEGCREYLEAGALLANVGQFISHSRHHLHSYYVIRNAERLVGFTDAEIERIALIARYHRKGKPKPGHREFGALAPEDQAVVRTLAGLLRVAIALDRTQRGAVRALAVDAAGSEAVVLRVSGRPGADLTLELHAADARKGLLEDVLGRPVVVVDASAG